MVSSRWFRLAGLPLVATASLIFSLSSGFAKINQAGALMVPATATPKSCSAFRYSLSRYRLSGQNDTCRRPSTNILI